MVLLHMTSLQISLKAMPLTLNIVILNLNIELQIMIQIQLIKKNIMTNLENCHDRKHLKGAYGQEMGE